MTVVLIIVGLFLFATNPIVAFFLLVFAKISSDTAGTQPAPAPVLAPPPLTPEALLARRLSWERADLEEIEREIEDGAELSDFTPADLELSDDPRPWENCGYARPFRFMGKPVPHEATVGADHHGPVWTSYDECVWRGPKRRPMTPSLSRKEHQHLYALGWPLLTARGTPWPTKRQRAVTPSEQRFLLTARAAAL